ncbi:MAG: glycoside hydrolase family 127 protein [Clostridia bacterium]|nr:glycoside hydrolase family 127 protein [Clostridia bacterium]
MIDYKIKDKFELQHASFFGYTEEIYQKIIDRRMTSDFAVENVLAEAEEQFITRIDDKYAPVGMWRGEFWGKWIISAVRACKYKKNAKLAGIIRKSVDKIIATANEDGYIGTYQNSKLILPCTKEEGLRAIGFRCDFCWNIWCEKYTLWGLIEAYELLGDQNILESAEKMAIQIIDTVHETGVNPCETGTFFGVASGSIMKPILSLYRITGNQRLLDFAIEIADGFERDDVRSIKLIKNSLNDLPIHLWNYSNPFAVAKRKFDNQKAYEMMSCFEGICELYRLTGIEKYFVASKKFYDLLIKYEYNRLFSVGFNDRFLFASSVEDAISEPCDIVHFLRLTEDLYRLTGDVAYLDYYEKAFLNAFLASPTRDGTWGARAIRSMSHHVAEYDVVDMKHNQCCVNNLPRTFASTADLMATANENGVFLNLYLPSEINAKKAKITVSDGYTQYCKVSVKIDATEAVTVHFRIPEWSIHTTITCNGTEYKAHPCTYVAVPVAVGESQVDIQFDNTPRVQYCDLPRDMLPLTPFYQMRYDMHSPAEHTRENRATLCIGPILLALTTQLGTDWRTITERATVNGKCKQCTATPTNHEGMLCSYDVTFEIENGTETLPMCDYASASNRFVENDFSIFV